MGFLLRSVRLRQRFRLSELFDLPVSRGNPWGSLPRQRQKLLAVDGSGFRMDVDVRHDRCLQSCAPGLMPFVAKRLRIDSLACNSIRCDA